MRFNTGEDGNMSRYPPRDGRWLSAPPPGEEVCISGLSGAYPESRNVHEFRGNMFNKVDMVTHRCCTDKCHPLLPDRRGKIQNIEKFDAAFFGLHFKQANYMVANLRLLMEKTYECIVDAGITPKGLQGTRTGVFLSSAYSESEGKLMYDNLLPNGHVLTCVTGASWATRISYWLGVTGPSYSVDTACSSSSFALDHAYQAIRDGRIDQAIVGGGNLLLNELSTIEFARLGVMSPGGMSRSFDNKADGYARSEGAVVFLLQKAKDAKRIYATLVHSKTNNDGYKEQGITYPNGKIQQQLMEGFYDECQVDPASLAWVEAHGTGTKVGDPEELDGIANVFCKNRTSALPIGSLKSNIGHTEFLSGLCSISKVIIAMESGLIPPNLHYRTPREGVAALVDGRLKVVTEAMPWKGGLVGINSFGFGGANSHVLLRSNPKVKLNGGAPSDSIPRLVTISGRTEQAVRQILDELESRPVDVEQVRLLHDVFSINTEGHLYRGFTVLQTEKTNIQIEYYPKCHRPVWCVFSYTDYHWTRLATSLLALPCFARVFDTCNEALKTKHLDLYEIIREDRLDTRVKVVVCITAVQICLIELLRTLGVYPDGVIADSVGKMAAGYLSGASNIEQAMLAAYNEGVSQRDTNGIADRVRSIAKSSISSFASLGSSKYWMTSSDLNGQSRLTAGELLAKSSLQPVSMEEATRKVPRHTVLVGMTSDTALLHLLTASRKRTLNVSLIDDDVISMDHVLTALGRLYMAGVGLQLANLYPPVSFPVSRGTPMISPLIGWDHSQDWYLPDFTARSEFSARERDIEIDVNAKNMTYYTGHVVDGRNLFPATGYLCLVWETYAGILGKVQEKMAVVFEDVRFLRATNLRKDGKTLFTIMIQKVSGRFEVVENGDAVVTGRVSNPNNKNKELRFVSSRSANENHQMEMNTKDVYKELRLRGYNYSGVFKSIISADSIGRTAKVRWLDNWTAFMDNMLQTQILTQDTRGLFVPTSIDRLSIDPELHLARVEDMKLELQDTVFEVVFTPEIGIVQGGGVEILGMNAAAISRRKTMAEPVLERHCFIPNNIASLGLAEALRVCVHVALENQMGVAVKAVELVDSEARLKQELLSPILATILGDLPLIQADITVLSSGDNPLTKDLDPSIKVEDLKLTEMEDCLFVMGTNVLERLGVLDAFLTCTKGKGLLVSREASRKHLNRHPGIDVLNEYDVGTEIVVLVKKRSDLIDPLVIHISNSNFSWISSLQVALKNKSTEQRTILVSQGDDLSGVMGLFNCIRREPNGIITRCLFILDPKAPPFDPELSFYKTQLSKDLAMNVYKDGEWGSYRHLPSESNTEMDVKHAFVNVTNRGDLSSLKWLQGPIDPISFKLGNDEEMVYVYYAALNFRDIMVSTGKLAGEVVVKNRLNQECLIGLEFSGRDSRGRRVMGMAAAECVSTLVVTDKKLIWEIPDDWTLEDAATVPVTYSTVLFAFEKSGRYMEKGETLLIHAGSGGVGQAAIFLALRAGCTVYTTVGTQEKRDFIKQRFPQLTDRNIGNSRDSSFEQFVMSETNGRGVDIVLNCLAGELLQASVRCLAVGGRFLEIGKVDMVANTLIDVETFATGRSFHGIMLDLFNCNEETIMKIYTSMKDRLANDDIQPLTRINFSSDKVEQAFRYMAAGKHLGKVLIQMRPEEKERLVIPTIMSKKALPKFFCRPNNSYVVAGGLGGFGLELADWLVLRGARKIVLTSRSGLTSGYQRSRVRTWRSYGVSVQIATDDITTEQGVNSLLNTANQLGPVAAIFNLAVVLLDAIFENQTPEQFVTSFGPKATATQHMDQLSRRLCPQLEHFVIFSSVSCGRGNAGQTNYGMANSVMERICERRVQEGYPGLAVQWGAVGDVGLVADKMEDHKELVIGGTLQQGISSCLQVLDGFLSQTHPVVSSMVVAEKKLGGTGNLVDYVAGMLAIKDVKSVSENATLAEMGIDSLLVVEMKQALEQQYEVILSPREIRNMTFKTLADMANSGAANSQEKSYEWNVNAFHFLVKAFSDESAASKEVVDLPSMSSGGVQPTLFMIPGIEGMASIFESLAKMISLNVKGLQLVNLGESFSDTVSGIAQKLLQNLKKSLAPNEPFKILGHSFGGVVALQLALLLEEEGHQGHIYLLDSSPEFVQTITKLQMKNYWNYDIPNEDNLQINTLLIMLDYLKNEDSPAVREQTRLNLTKMSTWGERVDLFLSLLPENTNHSRSYSTSVVNALRSRMKAISDTPSTVSSKLKSSVTLFRPHYKGLKIEQDYGLSMYCEKPVCVHMIDADHVSIVESTEVATVINSEASSKKIDLDLIVTYREQRA